VYCKSAASAISVRRVPAYWRRAMMSAAARKIRARVCADLGSLAPGESSCGGSESEEQGGCTLRLGVIPRAIMICAVRITVSIGGRLPGAHHSLAQAIDSRLSLNTVDASDRSMVRERSVMASTT